MLSFINKDFKRKFTEVSLLNNSLLMKDLLDVFRLQEGHYAHSVLNLYYRKYPRVFLDRGLSDKMIESEFDHKTFYIVDFEEPYNGGYPNLKNDVINQDQLINNPEDLQLLEKEWSDFVTNTKSKYWLENKNCDIYEPLKNLNFLEAREALTSREIFFLQWEYKFFNLNNVTSFFMSLMEAFLPDFQLIENKKLTNKKIKRFGKRLKNDIYLGLYIDFGFFEKELKNFYLELPAIKIELFSNTIKNNIREEYYIIDQEDFPIARIGLPFSIGMPFNSRIGNSSLPEDVLKKDFFFQFDVYTFYLKIYLKRIEENLRLII